MEKLDPASCNQAGVIPCRKRKGQLEILLVTSRTSRRWIIPKGNLEPGLDARETARLEALEEAGIRGSISEAPIGAYLHGVPPKHRVLAFVMEVEYELSVWAEMEVRTRRWMPLPEAKKAVAEAGLRALLGKIHL